jgi:hypothetical protein
MKKREREKTNKNKFDDLKFMNFAITPVHI